MHIAKVHFLSFLLFLSAALISYAEEKKEGSAPAPGHSHSGESFNEGPRQSAVKVDGTGDVHFPITTKWSRGQQMFDQGIGQLHGFWFYEAERTFRQIAAEDPECAMAYWGMAMANWENSKRAKGFIAKAVELKDKISERERLYINAQEAFLADEPKDVKKRRQKLIEDMENIIHEFSDDIEAKAILAVRLWQFSRQGIPIGSRESVDALMQQVFEKNPLHPAHHFRIHLWDGKKPQRALSSAAVLHKTAPAIAHMWHMPGHIYDKLKRYAESAYHQEASARIDHAKQSDFQVLPDTIHNYAHNNEWLVRNWNHVGRADDAIIMSKGLIDNPQHPRLNHFGKGYCSASFGRKRLTETLERFEKWNEILQLSKTHYLEPTQNDRLQLNRLLLMSRAHFELGDKDSLIGVSNQIRERIDKAEQLKKKKKDEARQKAEKEKKNKEETDKIVKEAGKASDDQLKYLRPAIEEINVCLDLLNGEKLNEERAKKIKRKKISLAMLHLKYGDPNKAKELSGQAVNENQNRTVPLAVRIHVLEKTGDQSAASMEFSKLETISAHIQLDAAPFSRLLLVAKRLGKSDDWRAKEPWRSQDFGSQKPQDLNHLGPLVYQSPTAPDFDLLGEDGSRISLKSFSGKPVILIFYLGHNCEHCVEQLNNFAPLASKFKGAGIELVAVGPEPLAELAKAHDLCSSGEKRFPFPLFSDLESGSFKDYRAYDDFEDMPLHGVFLIDQKGRLRWMDVGPEPFQNISFLLRESKRLLSM
jgi:peroxiredoxin